MGDPARQSANGFHLLRLAQLLLQIAIFCDILGHANPAPDRAGGITNRKGAVTNAALGSIWPDNSVFLIVRALSPLDLQGADHAIPITGTNRIEPHVGLLVGALASDAPYSFIGWTNV